MLKFIKILSSILMSCALIVEGVNLYQVLTHRVMPQELAVILLIAHLGILIHFIEAVLAAFYAPLKDKKAIPSGVYTFFTGTVGLVELFDEN